MLLRLVRLYAAPYRRPLTFVVVLQFIGTMGALYLPSLNADIIDNGVITGDTAYIFRIGALMLGVTFVQIICSVGAVWFGARTAMSFGRDVRTAIFHRVGTFSQREVQDFGAPSLITRQTNDVQQVQMLVLLSCTLMVMAPIMMVGGIIMAIREDLGLSWLIAVTVPVLAVLLGFIISRMVPSFRLMQARIDEVNRLLREQITGVRVVRAFVREPRETERFDAANRDLTTVAIRAGRWQALMFPTVMLVANVASVAVLWFGGHRVESGEMQIGALTAYLSYLLQIVMAVMMGTFMMMMIPRSAVCADRMMEVLDTDSSVVPSADPVIDLPERGTLSFDGVEFSYPGADAPVLQDLTFRAEPGKTVAVIGSTGAGKSTLVNRRHGRGRRHRRTPAGSRPALVGDRADPTEGISLQRNRALQPPARQAGGDRRRALEGARDRPGRRLRARHARGPRRTDRAGRHQRQRWSAAAPRDRPRRRTTPGDLSVRRLLLGPRPRHGRPAASGPASGHPRRDRPPGRPAGLDHPRRRPDPRARGRPSGRPRHPPRAARRLPDVPGDRGVPAEC
jgi:ABC-type siderophore export system fused ATPase/permease subunit